MSTRSLYVVPERKTERGRLNAIARLVEQYPEAVDMNIWARAASSYDAAVKHTCGSAGCLAGWGTAATPIGQLVNTGDQFFENGQVAFGLTHPVALALFNGVFVELQDDEEQGEHYKGTFARRAARCLRWLASLSHEERRRVKPRHIELHALGKHVRAEKLALAPKGTVIR